VFLTYTSGSTMSSGLAMVALGWLVLASDDQKKSCMGEKIFRHDGAF
tara:strand:- start:168 stop:308 length:141 start_codon:yes stop_codon:yes gene_type:complete